MVIWVSLTFEWGNLIKFESAHNPACPGLSFSTRIHEVVAEIYRSGLLGLLNIAPWRDSLGLGL